MTVITCVSKLSACAERRRPPAKAREIEYDGRADGGSANPLS